MSQSRLSRRQLLRYSLLGTAGLALSACQPKVVEVEKIVEKEVEKVVKETVVVKEAVEVEKEVTRVVKEAVEAPKGKITLQYWLPPTTEQVYREKMINEFMDLNPDIEIKMDGADPANYNEATALLFKGGTPPDVFWKYNLSMIEMIENKMVMPYPEDAQNYMKGAYDAAYFLEGINSWEGDVYGFWPVGPKTATRVLYCNNKLFDAAGVEPPTTWSDFVSVAIKLAEAGAGQSYGLIVGGKSPWDYTALIGALAYTAGKIGAAGGENQVFDWTEGKMVTGNAENVMAMELVNEIVQKGAMFPGFTTISHTEARAGLASDWAGMYMGGWWDSGAYNTKFPDFDYSIVKPPEYDGGMMGYNHGSTFIDRVYVAQTADTDKLEAISRFLTFKFGPAYQRGWARNGWFTGLPEANEASNIADPKVKSLFAISDVIRAVPEPVARNFEQAKVAAKRTPQAPNWGSTIEGVFSGQLTLDDYKPTCDQYCEDWRADLEKSIKEVQDAGGNVSIDDWIFPNWDPDKDYTSDLYGAL